MSCLHPHIAFYDTRVTPARVVFKPRQEWLFLGLPAGVSSISIPCGKCFGCLKSRALDITVRAVAESRMHDFSSFVTLTVSDDELSFVFPHGLEHRPFQLFAKRLRKKIGKFSFLMCGEYGARTMRPHYHAVIFGHRFVDSSVDTPSVVLRDAWQHGNIMVDDVNSNRIAYVSGYTCKDYVLGRGKDFYNERGLGQPYIKWSRRPALGLTWLRKYYSDLVDDHMQLSFVLDGKSFNFGGRYFLKKLALLSPADYDNIIAQRRGLSLQDDTTRIMRYENNKRAVEVRQYQLRRKSEVACL